MALLFLLLACQSPLGPEKGGSPDSAVEPDSAPPVDSADTDDTADSGAPAELPSLKIRISELMSDCDEALEDGDGEASDWVELYNPGPTVIDLTGFTLEEGDAAYTFGAETLDAGAFLLVFASGKGSGGPAGERHADFRLDAGGGEVVVLRDATGALVDRLEAPPLGPDQSYGPAEPVTAAPLVGPGSAVRWMADPAADFADPATSVESWAAATLPIGYDGEEGGGDAVNAALGAPTTQSSDGYGFTGAQAVDGDPLTFSHTGDGDLNPWLEVDLGGPVSLSAIRLQNRVGCCPERLYNIDVSVVGADGSLRYASATLNPVAAGDRPTSPGDFLDLNLDPIVTGSRLRVEKAAYAGTEWLSLGELVATGSRATPYAESIETEVSGAPIGLRATFTLDSLPSRLVATAQVDDQLQLWLNGALAAEVGAAGEAHDGLVAAPLALSPTTLQVGENTIAGLVSTVDEDDLLLGLQIEAQWITVGAPAFFATSTPGAPNGQGYTAILEAPAFDPPRGLYEGDLDLTLSGATPGATLVYTTDGSLPTVDHGIVVPATEGPPTLTLRLTETALLRAILIQEGAATSPVATHSYLRLDQVIRQPAAPAGWPATWDGVSEGPVAADYEMDPEIVDPDPTAMVAALRAIPTLSIVADPAALFGPAGLYENSAERGAEWERGVSVEWLLPEGGFGFAETCGMRVHGYGWRAHSVTPKHSLRLEFSKDYGKGNLRYPLFPDAAVDRFDSVVLRAGGSKTWLDFRDPAQGQYLHDAFARDTARDMGKADGHATFAHVYLNGLYWGFYNLVERPEADFGARYFGGDADEYDAINRRTVTNEAIDGTLDAYLELLARAEGDLSTAEGLAAVEEMLDLDDLIDYMLIHQYMTNRDGPCCFASNNMRGLRRRLDGEPFRFFVWDMEYSLWEATDNTNVNIDVDGSISHVYTRLRANPDFRARYAARAALHLGPGGALSPEAASARYEARADEIYEALLAESARWGDHNRSTPYTREVEWQTEYDRLMTDYFPRRTALLEAQLAAAGLY
jgi:hypothetical protein